MTETRGGSIDNVCTYTYTYTYTYNTAGQRLTSTYTNGTGAVSGLGMVLAAVIGEDILDEAYLAGTDG